MQTDKQSVRQGEEFEVTISLENPLEVELTECELEIEGPGTLKPMEVKIKYVKDNEWNIILPFIMIGGPISMGIRWTWGKKMTNTVFQLWRVYH